MTLLTFAAKCHAGWCLPTAAVNRYLPPAGPTAANQLQATAAAGWDRQKDGQRDRWTPYHYTDPIVNCMNSVSKVVY